MKFLVDATNPSTDALKCLITAQFTGVKITPTTPINTAKGEHKKPDFQQKSPLGHLPVLEIDNHTYLTNANVICRYLCSKNDKVLLIGSDFNGSLVDQWLELESTLSTDVLLQKLNTHLDKQENKKRVVGDRSAITLADIVLWSTLYRALSSKFENNQRANFPVAAQWFDDILADHDKFFNQALSFSQL